MKKYFGDWQFYKSTLLISLPIMAQQLVTATVTLLANVMIGSIGGTALTAVTVANRFYLLFNSTLFGICGAAGIFIAQYYGAKEKDKCQRVFNINVVWSIIIALLFMLVLFIMPQTIINLFSKTPEIVNESLKYMKYAKYSFLPYGVTFTCMMALRAVGITKIQLKIGCIAVIIDVIINYLLIYGNLGFPKLGVEGAAIATTIARIVEMSCYVYIVYRKKHFFKLDFSGLFNLDKDIMKSLITKAIPLTINEILFALGLALIYKSYMRADEYLVAAVSVVDTVQNIMFIVFGGLSSAVAILIGKRLGANELDEARDNSRKLITFGAMIALTIGTIIFIAAPYIPELYNLNPDVKSVIIILLRVKSVMLVLYVVDVCIFFILRAGGDAVSTLIMDAGFLWCAGVFVSTMLSVYTALPLLIIYIIVESLDIIKLFVAFHFFKKERWIKNIAVDMDTI